MKLPLVCLIAAGLMAACDPGSVRPYPAPVPGALDVEVGLDIPDATELLAQQLAEDSIPVSVTAPRDGYLETSWFEAASGAPTRSRPLGPGVVRVRAWVNSAAERHSDLLVEVVYREVFDPSLDQRELDLQVPGDHPVARRVARSLSAMSANYPPRHGVP